MDPINQSMPSLDAMTKVEYSPGEWLLFYKNVWVRNLVARTIDMERDAALKSANPEKLVEYNGAYIPVKERLEHFKMNVEDALAIVNAINALRTVDADGKLLDKWSPEALAVAPDMQESDANHEKEVTQE